MSDYKRDTYHAYNDMIDECEGTVVVGGITYPASLVWLRTDPIAYEVGMSDWLSELEANGDYCAECDTFAWASVTCIDECECEDDDE